MFNGKLRMLVKNPHYKKIIPLIISHDFGSFIISFFSDKKKKKKKKLIQNCRLTRNKI
jgi:hypothetical protein